MSYEQWMEGWGVSSKGTPYRESDPWDDAFINMGINHNHKGYHFWINRPHCHFMFKEFVWSEGYATEDEAMRMLYGYLYEHKKAMIMVSEQYIFDNKPKADGIGEQR